MATLANNPAAVQTVLAAARSQLGVPYHWAWEKPGAGFDCSGLTQWAYGQAGIKIPRTTVLQVLQGSKVAKADLQPGDLVFPQAPIHHVQIYTGGGQIIESPQTGETVTERPMWGFFTARRIVGGGSSVTTPATGVQGFNPIGDAAAAAGSMLIPGLPNFNDLFSHARGFMIRVIEGLLGIALVVAAIATIGGEKATSNPMFKTAVKAIK